MNTSFRTALFTIVALFVFSAVAVPEYKAQGVLSQILRKMDENKDNLVTLVADVRMAKTNTQLNITTTQEGEVWYRSEGDRKVAVRINWTDPDEVLVVHRGEYLLYRPRLKQAITGKSEGSKNAKANNALSFMNMSKKELTDNYEVKFLGNVSLGGAQVWHLGLTPKTKQSYKSAELWVNGDGMPVQAKINESNGDITTVRLSKIRKNEVPIKGSLFTVKLPKDVKVIKG